MLKLLLNYIAVLRT